MNAIQYVLPCNEENLALLAVVLSDEVKIVDPISGVILR